MGRTREREKHFYCWFFYFMCTDWFRVTVLNVAGANDEAQPQWILCLWSQGQADTANFQRNTIEKNWVIKINGLSSASLTFSIPIPISIAAFLAVPFHLFSLCECVFSSTSIFMQLINLIRFHACTLTLVCVFVRVRVTIRAAIALIRSVLNSTAAFS